MSTTLCLGSLGAANPVTPKTAAGPITTTPSIITPASAAQAKALAVTYPDTVQAGPYAVTPATSQTFDLSSIDFTSPTTWIIIGGAGALLWFMFKK